MKLSETSAFSADGDGVKIHLGEWAGTEPSTAAPIFCVHGLTANHTCFAPIAEALQGGFRVLAMDLRGRGLSDKPASGYSLDQHCRDIAAVIKSLNLGKVVFMGHSLGAYIGMAFASDYPHMVDKLVLVDGGADLTEAQWAEVSAGIGPAVERLGRVSPSAQAYLDLVKQAPYLDPWNQATENYFLYEIEEVPDGVRSKVSPDHIAEERANLGQAKPDEYYSRVHCPVLILRAEQGMLGGDELLLPQDAVDRMGREIADCRIVNLPQANHYSIMFLPTVFSCLDAEGASGREYVTRVIQP